ncbi:LysR family transcriptional regulator [Anderseniella sp. Alg231-50]|uniref:LysR family transcriptional regulator n=1 Tax=Anderseniella sp. Alg231-50 TaxID=1922226 RepID=UPI00307C73B8
MALKTFLAVVQTGNLNKAADIVNVTQSTVTARLDALDSELGQALLVRSRKGAQLTKAGFAFQRHAELMVRTWEQGRKAVGLPSGYSGMVSLAVHDDLWAGLGERWIDLAQSEQADIAFEAWPGEHGDSGRWLNSGLVDAAITLAPVTGDDITCCELTQDRLVQVSSAPRSAMEWDENYIFVDLGADFRRQHSLAWPTDNTARIAFGSSAWALDYLLRKGGSAYLPWRMSEPHVAGGRLHVVQKVPEISRAVYFNCRRASAQEHPWLEHVHKTI